MNNSVQSSKSSKKSVASLTLGILALITAIIPFLGFILGALAIIFGILGMRESMGKGKAITGLVTGALGVLISFLMIPILVFIATPALQRNQKDVAMKNDVSTLVSIIVSFQASNQGRLPTQAEVSGNNFTTGLTDSFVSFENHDQEGSLRYSPGTDCSGAASARRFSVSTLLSNGERFCIDNS